MTSERAERIIELLQSSDLTISEIAERVGSSRSAVASVNRRQKIRDYSGLRSHWIVTPRPAPRNTEAGQTWR